MKISILGLRGLPSSYSGYETFINELAPRLVERGHEVTVYCRSPLYLEKPSFFGGTKLIYLPSIEHKFFSTLSHTFFSIIHASLGEADLIFVLNAANGIFGIIPRVLGKSCILSVDGMEWLRPKWNNLAKSFFKRSARLGCLFYHRVVTDAQEMQRVYAQDFKSDSTYIAYGANIEGSTHPEILNQYNLLPRGYYFAAGRLVADNNADLIIKGFVASGSTKILAIAGSADYAGNRSERLFFSKLRAAASDRVKFLGHVDKPGHFRELQSNCYAYIHAHQYGGINPSLLQAMGNGACVLALDTPFNDEVLEAGRSGLMFQRSPEDLAQLIRSIDQIPSKIHEMGFSAQQRIRERFSWTTICDEYENLFKTILIAAND